jgi:hypothetical protein
VVHSKPSRTWAAFAVSLAAALTVPGCQDGYPIAPTACDRYCALGPAPGCGDHNPTACVVSCEATTFSHACPIEFDEWVGCLKEHNHRLECNDSVVGMTQGCESEQQAFSACVTAHDDEIPGDSE